MKIPALGDWGVFLRWFTATSKRNNLPLLQTHGHLEVVLHFIAQSKSVNLPDERLPEMLFETLPGSASTNVLLLHLLPDFVSL